MPADFRLNGFVEIRGASKATHFPFGHLQVLRRIDVIIDGTDSQDEVIEVAHNGSKIFIVFGFIGMLQKCPNHPDVRELRVDRLDASEIGGFRGGRRVVRQIAIGQHRIHDVESTGVAGSGAAGSGEAGSLVTTASAGGDSDAASVDDALGFA